MQIPPDGTFRFNVDRNGAQRVVEVKATDLRSVPEPLGYAPIHPVVGQVTRGMPARRGGLKRGDLILSVNGTAVSNWLQWVDLIKRSRGETLDVVVKRK